VVRRFTELCTEERLGETERITKDIFAMSSCPAYGWDRAKFHKKSVYLNSQSNGIVDTM